MKNPPLRLWWLVLAALLAVETFAIYYFRDRIRKGETDFASFYAASRAVQQGRGREIGRASCRERV